MINDDVREAAILFSPARVESNSSFRAADVAGGLSKEMFPDSEIAKGYSYGWKN